MLEIEMKFPVNDFTSIERQLQQWGATGGEQRTDCDQYYNAPDRDFARTDEAFRWRTIGKEHFLTYKGPKTDNQTKTRVELELPLKIEAAEVPRWQRLLRCLGYRSVLLVEKQRRVWYFQRAGFTLETCLDEVAELGRFVELEIQAPTDQLDSARQVLLTVAGELGLAASERRSYLELLLAHREGQS